MSNQSDLHRSQHDIITLQNVDDEDFVFEYDRSRGNYPYSVKAGAVVRYPRFLAEHALKKMIDKILDKKSIKLNNEAARAELRERIFIGEEVFQTSAELPEAEKLRREVEGLNKASDLDAILVRNAAKVKPYTPSIEEPVSDEAVKKEEFDGLSKDGEAKKAKNVGETVDTTEPPKKVSKTDSKPTRLQILKYAEDKLGLTLDKKTMERIDKLSDEELINEFQYPID